MESSHQANLFWSPWKQAAIIVMLEIAFIPFAWLAGIEARTWWTLLQAPVLLFCCMNILMGIFSDTHHIQRYYFLSSIAFVLVFLTAITMSYIFSGGNPSKFTGVIKILILNPLFYFMISLVAILYRGIIKILESMD